ncbi:MAG: FMN-binding protein [bacterium]
MTTLLLTIAESPGQSQVFKTQELALKQAFPGDSVVQRRVLFLTDKQVSEIEKLAKTTVESKIVTYYEGARNNSTLGYAFFETNIVRTKPETFLVLLTPAGTVKKVEMLAFYEPMDYFPTANWFKLFKGKRLNDTLWPKRGIHNITGATLTVRAVTKGVRTILAIYQIAISGVTN